MSDLYPLMAAGAVLVLLLRLAWRVDGPRPTGGNLRGGDAYCPPPPPANPPAPPRREVYVLSGSPSLTTMEPRAPNAPDRTVAHIHQFTGPFGSVSRNAMGCIVCSRCGAEAHRIDEDDERTVLDPHMATKIIK